MFFLQRKDELHRPTPTELLKFGKKGLDGLIYYLVGTVLGDGFQVFDQPLAELRPSFSQISFKTLGITRLLPQV